jgi:predicted nucleic acid-binding protein
LRGYFDSGFLFKLYWREPNSPAALAILQKFHPPLVMSRFNEIEMLHVARRKTWMLGPSGVPQMTASQFQAGLSLFEQGLQTGVLARLEVEYDEVFDAASELSRKFGQTIPVRTADLLHVAMMEFGFDEFITADKQQHDFAVRAGYPATFLPP